MINRKLVTCNTIVLFTSYLLTYFFHVVVPFGHSSVFYTNYCQEPIFLKIILNYLFTYFGNNFERRKPLLWTHQTQYS